MVTLLLLILPSLSFLFFFFSRKDRELKNELTSFPKISVIVAVRNEAEKLPEFIEALMSLNYPSRQLEILFGNDCSDDGSKNILEQLVQNKNYCELYDIYPTEIQDAKANVLMQLCRKATGDFLYFLDVDVIPNPEVVTNYLKFWQKDYAGITGVSLPAFNTSFQGFQRVEWCLALSLFSDANKWGIDSTAMGNNMFVSKEAYERVGGYEKLPKSLVEDFTLYKKFRSKGYHFPVIFHEGLCAETSSQGSLKELLAQRKRWMSGLKKLSVSMLAILSVHSLFYPVALCSFYFYPVEVGALWLTKLFVQTSYIFFRFKRLKTCYSLLDILLFEFYNCIIIPLYGFYYFLPTKIKWKNRSYENY